jgi:hypothetical protein
MNRIFTIILLLFNISLFAQSNCERNLEDARSDYSTGNLYAIPGKLTDCLKEGFTKNEKIEAYRLLTLTYLNINQNEKAKESFIKLLNIKTDYRATPGVDPPELYSLYRKIDTDPKYFIGAIVGINYNTIQIQKLYQTGTVRGATDVNYQGSYAFQGGGQFILPILKNFWVKAEALYQNQRFDFTQTSLTYNNTENPGNTEFTEYLFSSTNHGINLNLSARNVIDNYSLKPFVEYGISGRYNINYNFLEYTSSYSPSADQGLVDEIDMTKFRNQVNVGFHLNVGTMIKMGENYGELKIGASKFLLVHASYANDTERFINKIGTQGERQGKSQGEILDNDYTNLIYQMSFSFNIPFFNFQ